MAPKTKKRTNKNRTAATDNSRRRGRNNCNHKHEDIDIDTLREQTFYANAVLDIGFKTGVQIGLLALTIQPGCFNSYVALLIALLNPEDAISESPMGSDPLEHTSIRVLDPDMFIFRIREGRNKAYRAVEILARAGDQLTLIQFDDEDQFDGFVEHLRMLGLLTPRWGWFSFLFWISSLGGIAYWIYSYFF